MPSIQEILAEKHRAAVTKQRPLPPAALFDRAGALRFLGLPDSPLNQHWLDKRGRCLVAEIGGQRITLHPREALEDLARCLAAASKTLPPDPHEPDP